MSTVDSFVPFTRRIVAGTALSAVAAFALGCTCGNDPTPPSPTQQINQATQKSQEAARDMKDYSFAEKEEFTATMQDQLDELNRDLDQLAISIQNSGSAVKAEASPKLQALRDQSASLTKQLDQVRSADASTWTEVKSAFTSGVQSTKDGINSARTWVSETVAP